MNVQLLTYKGFNATYFFQNYTKNGNSMWVINIFDSNNNNVNHNFSLSLNLKLDKHNNIKHVKQVSIDTDIKKMIDDHTMVMLLRDKDF